MRWGSLASFIKVILVIGCKKPRQQTSISRSSNVCGGVLFIAGVPSRSSLSPSPLRVGIPSSLPSIGFILFIATPVSSFFSFPSRGFSFRGRLPLPRLSHPSRDKSLWKLVITVKRTKITRRLGLKYTVELGDRLGGYVGSSNLCCYVVTCS